MCIKVPQTGPNHASDRTLAGHSVEEAPWAVSENFVRELRTALHYLYDWAHLRRSPLVKVFKLDPQQDSSMALRRLLLDAIEDLKPAASVPPKSKVWRVYRLLHARFTEQFTQVEVANELGLSVRHLRREEAAAIQRLAGHLWHEHDLGTTWAARGKVQGEARSQNARPVHRALTPDEELERLHESVPPEMVDVAEIVDAALAIARPLAQESGVELEVRAPARLMQVNAQRASICQALTTILTAGTRRLANGKVIIRWSSAVGHVVIYIEMTGEAVEEETHLGDGERLEMARRLIKLSGGSLHVDGLQGSDEPLGVTIALPGSEKVRVLVVDDNTDALRLFERYLSASQYEFIGTQDPEEVLELAEETAPRVIILDVMLPHFSGWEILARLREHPVTGSIPIVVCTILPEEQLALDLGAVAFIRKPFTRQTLRSTIDGLLGCLRTESS